MANISPILYSPTSISLTSLSLSVYFLLIPTIMIPPKAPIMHTTSTSEIFSLNQAQARNAMRNGQAFITTKKIERGRYLIANTNMVKQRVPDRHRTTRIHRFGDAYPSESLSCDSLRYTVDAVRL